MIIERSDLPENVDVVRVPAMSGSTYYVRSGATARLLPLLASLGSATATRRIHERSYAPGD